MLRRGLGAVLAVVATVGSFVLALAPAAPADALSGSSFMPGLIISDSQFYDSAAMSESQIQQFLTSKGSGLAGFTFSVNSRARVTSSSGATRCEAFQGGVLAASTIIYRAQVACGISAKVLLVTLQKEQGLITKKAPSQSALDRAMGYACPDTAPCAPTTLGFGNQVYSGALQFITYKVSGFARQPGWNSIAFSPNAACGATTLYLQNYATAALYNYTPYQPNPAALANLSGTGDGCSSYGNRNFWVYYSSWFGSTLGPDPYPVVDPSIDGNSTLGTTLTVVPGNWGGAPSFGYAWMSCPSAPGSFLDSVPSSCTAIPGATTDSYVSTAADLNRYLAVLVTGTNSFGSMTTGASLGVPIGFPAAVVPPTVSGSTTVGGTWTVDTGTWSGIPTPSVAMAWLRCIGPVAAFSTVPGGCTAIAGATSTTYVSTSADQGKYLTAQVAGSNSLGFALAGAASRVPVGYPANATLPTVSGSSTVGSTWTLDHGTWTGTPAPTFVQAWLRCTSPIAASFTTVPPGCAAISGAGSTSYVSTKADIGKYLTAQVAGSNSAGFALAGATNAIAIVAAAPANTTPPTVSGSAEVGSTWTLTAGTWTGSPIPTFIQAWVRCDAPVTAPFTTLPHGCTGIPGANSTSYLSTTADTGKYLTAQVAGTNSSGFALAGAISTVAVAASAMSAPANTVLPSVAGSATVGSTWSLNVGTWTGSPAPTFVQAWLRCTSPVSAGFATVPAGCSAISGATSAAYVSTSADAGKYLTAQVAASNASGFALAGAISTTAVGVATASAPAVTVPPVVSGALSVGATLTVDHGRWSGSPAPTFVQAWLRCTAPVAAPFVTVPAGCTTIAGATGTTYLITASDLGRYLTAQVAGSNSAGFALSGAASTTATTPAVPSIPGNTVLPSVSGSASVGSTWTLSVGMWTGYPPPTFVQAWLRCSSQVTSGFTTVPAGCVAISGATSASYMATSADVGKYLTAQVAASNSLGFTLAGATSSPVIDGP